MNLRRIHRLTGLVVAFAALAAGGTSAVSAEPLDVRTPAAPRIHGSVKLTSLDDAVKRNRLDASVLRTLRSRGSVTAMVAFEQAGILASAQADAADRDGLEQEPDEVRRMTDDVAPALAAIKDAALDGVEVVQDYEYVGTSLVHFQSRHDLLRVLNREGVVGVRANTQVRAALAGSLPLIRQPQAAAAGYRGNGVSIAVLDSGANYAAFGCTAPGTPSTCRIAAAWDQAPNDGMTDDHIGHGSNVAGIVSGVAPGARIIAVDVFAGEFTNANIVSAAITRLIAMKRQGVNIRAFNLSVGSNGTHLASCPNSPYAQAFAAAKAVGILPVVSAGNDGFYNSQYRVGLTNPACVPGIVTVGAVYDGNNGSMTWGEAATPQHQCSDPTTAADQIVCFSQNSPSLTLFAPGAMLDAGGFRQGGTSQAAPHVAGAIAVLAAAKPSASNDQIVRALTSAGPTIVDNRPNMGGIQKRRLDLPGAIAALGVGGGTPSPTPGPGTGDRTAPSVSAPTQDVGYLWGLGTTVVPTTVSWSASDTSGISQYAVKVSVNGQAWADVSLPSPTTRSLTFDLQPDSTYRFIVAARDGAGNWSTWATGPAFKVYAYQETSSYIRYSGGWGDVPWAYAYGGAMRYTTVGGFSAQMTFVGQDFAWVAPRSTIGGRAEVFVDGVNRGVVDLYSATTEARRVVFTVTWPANGQHTVQIRNVGDTARPRIDVDAFLVLG